MKPWLQFVLLLWSVLCGFAVARVASTRRLLLLLLLCVCVCVCGVCAVCMYVRRVCMCVRMSLPFCVRVLFAVQDTANCVPACPFVFFFA